MFAADVLLPGTKAWAAAITVLNSSHYRTRWRWLFKTIDLNQICPFQGICVEYCSEGVINDKSASE